MREWCDRHPVVIVPTKYYSTPTDAFRDMGVKLVIWANHSLRAAVRAMQEATQRIFKEQSLVNVEDSVVPLEEIFRLQGDHELRLAERRYLPASDRPVNVIILAASQGDLGDLTREIPKTLLKVGGRTILSTQVETLNRVGIKDITVVRGFEKDKVNVAGLRTVDNDAHASTKDLYSLYLAREFIRSDTLISYGDVLYKTHALNDLLGDASDITLIADADLPVDAVNPDYIRTDLPYSRKLFSRSVRLLGYSRTRAVDATGLFFGLWRVSGNGGEIVKRALETLAKRPDFNELSVGDLFNEICSHHVVAVRFIRGSWLDVNTIVDLQKAGDFE